MPSSDTLYPRPPVVAIVTGQEWTSLSIMTVFSPRGFASMRIFTGAQALDRLRSGSVDLLIVDRFLQDMTAIELCRRLRALGFTIPVIVISTTVWERDEKLVALQSGAWDVCSLPVDAEELFLRVDNWVRHKLKSDQLSEQGLIDPNTGLYNIRGLLRRIAELGAGATRSAQPLACVVVGAYSTSPDPERNHCTPTAAAEMLAQILRNHGRASDAIGRLNETEFVVMAPYTNDEGAIRLAERLRGATESTTLVRSYQYDVRFGCYAVPNMREASIAPSELLIRAAEALRAAPDDKDQTIRLVHHRPLDQSAN